MLYYLLLLITLLLITVYHNYHFEFYNSSVELYT